MGVIMNETQLRIAQKIYSWEGVRSHCHVRRLKKKLAKSLWEDGFNLNEISNIIHSKPTHVNQYINEEGIDIGENDVMWIVLGILGIIVLPAIIGLLILPITIILLFVIGVYLFRYCFSRFKNGKKRRKN